MLFVWYLWAVKYYWVPISLIVVKVSAVLCPPVKDFILLCETLPRPVLYGCSFTLFLCCKVLDWLVCFLAVILSEACFYFLVSTLYPSLFCHLHLCPDLSFNLSIVFGSFWLFFFRSRLWSHRSRISGVVLYQKINFTAILSLPLIQEGQLSVIGERICTKYW